jgi:uncharacterized protein (TIGR03083 family)
MNRQQLLNKIDKAWAELQESYAGLPDAQLAAPGANADWSVKDILAHVTTWEEETLAYLPLIVAGGTPPRYASYGGLDAFNAQKIAQKRDLAPAEVLRQLDTVHTRLRDYVQSVPEEHFTRETRFRHRLRFDTYSHYPEHARMIREWRAAQEGDPGRVG